jgi:hypothetical protein|eukprot:COSAG01_NODE_160_length_23692_cov_9.703599_34_plen_112_part_00
MPGVHASQLCLPCDTSAKLPGAQAKHGVAGSRSWSTWPSGHCAQDVASAGAWVPTRQGSHSVAGLLSVSANPGSHRAQAVDAAGAKRPTGHDELPASVASQYFLTRNTDVT